ncbi:hypothetical protein APHNP_1044 [Anaplasma phagocytophilum str. ApNP]|uniref:Uncharacterized protein n=1 Tax=Anaplasma phagocytophilum str. ApNP TaxID=1359153 RepID=A0A0F3NIH4_ANAPH|nr:hypothetical protein APHNP_1044 [Anaplasma phagocytophilum str. ApNP]
MLLVGVSSSSCYSSRCGFYAKLVEAVSLGTKAMMLSL